MIDEIWTEDCPKAPEAPVFVLEDKYAGKSVKAKVDLSMPMLYLVVDNGQLEDLRKAMADEKQNAFVMVGNILHETDS